MNKSITFRLEDWEATGRVVIGVDVGDKQCCVRAVDEAGKVREGWVKTEREAIRACFSGGPKALVVLESGSQVGWIGEELRAIGHQPKVVDPVQAAAMRQQPWYKDDEKDTWTLTEMGWIDLARPGFVRTVWERTERNRRHLMRVRSRAKLVETRTKVMNTVKSTLKELGIKLPKRSAKAMVNKLPQELKPEELALVKPLLAAIEALNKAVAAYEAEIDEILEGEYAEVNAQFKEVDSVGEVMTSTFVLTVAEPERFKKSRSVGPYFGLAEGRKQSGEHDPKRRITRRGDKLTRRISIQCAQRIVGPKGKDCDLRRWALEKIGESKDKALKKRVVVAVARKLLVLLHYLWVSGKTYDPFYETKRRQGGVLLAT